MTSKQPVRGIVLVLGSKPNAQLPVISPEVVFASNNAIELATFYREKYGTRIISIVNGDIFDSQEMVDSIMGSVQKSQPDEVIFFGPGKLSNHEQYIQKELGLKSKVTIVSNKERFQLIFKALKGRSIFPILIRLCTKSPIHVIKVCLPDLFGKQEALWMSRSSGLNSIFYCLNKFPQHKVVTAGIGLVAGAHFNNIGSYTEKTAKVDQLVMRFWPKKLRKNLYTTDREMYKNWNIELWDDDVTLS